MVRQYIESELIESTGYDSETCTLEIEFRKNHVVWQYYEFPEYMWYEFMNAASKGRYFLSQIREEFTPKGHQV